MHFPKSFGLERWIPQLSIYSWASPGPLSAVWEVVVCRPWHGMRVAHGAGRSWAALCQPAGTLAAWGSPDQPVTSYTNPWPSTRGTCGHGAGEGIWDCPEWPTEKMSKCNVSAVLWQKRWVCCETEGVVSAASQTTLYVMQRNHTDFGFCELMLKFSEYSREFEQLAPKHSWESFLCFSSQNE